MTQEWIFPERLQCFNPKGTRFEAVFENPVALAVFAQFRRKHIVSGEMNDWLPTFASSFSEAIKSIQAQDKKVDLDRAVKIWDELFATSPQIGRDDDIIKWRQVLEPMLPFLNGEKWLRLKEDLLSGEFFLVVRSLAQGYCPECDGEVMVTIKKDGTAYRFCRDCGWKENGHSQ